MGHKAWIWAAILVTAVGLTGCNQVSSPQVQANTGFFQNPIMNSGADPWAIYSNGEYYLTMTTGSNVTIWASKDLTNISQGQSKVVWTPPSNFADIWAPELHHIGNRWYIYVAADRGGDNATHRMYVLESDTDSPLSNYKFVGKLSTPDNHWAIDGTVLSLNKKLYFIWSGWQGDTNGPQNLYIASMSSPTQISSQRVEISSPTYPWETSVAPINEGPEVLKHDGKVFVVYSANASWTNAYCLGLLTLTGSDPMQRSSWVKSPQPVFQSSDSVYGPGHASFTVSPNGKQDWIVYHAARYSNSGWDRSVRTQPFTWAKNGQPDFGAPVPTSQLLKVPAGEASYRVLVQGKSQHGAYSFHFSTQNPGNYTIFVHYSNPGLDSLANMTVNGQSVQGPYLTKTGAADSFQMSIAAATFRAGDNTVTISENGLGSGTIDHVWVSLQPTS